MVGEMPSYDRIASSHSDQAAIQVSEGEKE